MLSSPLLYPQRKRTPPSLVSSTESMITFCRGLLYASVIPGLSAVALMLRVCMIVSLLSKQMEEHCEEVNCYCKQVQACAANVAAFVFLIGNAPAKEHKEHVDCEKNS